MRLGFTGIRQFKTRSTVRPQTRGLRVATGDTACDGVPVDGSHSPTYRQSKNQSATPRLLVLPLVDDLLVVEQFIFIEEQFDLAFVRPDVLVVRGVDQVPAEIKPVIPADRSRR